MFIFKFIGINRIDRSNTIVKLTTIATTEQEARRQFARNYVLFFSARIKTEALYGV